MSRSLFRVAVDNAHAEPTLHERITRLREEAAALTRRDFADLAAKWRALAAETAEFATLPGGPVGPCEAARSAAEAARIHAGRMAVLAERGAVK